MYRDKDCMKKFCESLREHAMNIINFKNKKNEIMNILYAKDANYCEFREHCHYAGVTVIVIITKELPEEFEKQIVCLKKILKNT